MLPALGEVDVRQVTLDELVGQRVEVRGRRPGAASRSSRATPRMATVLRRAVQAGAGRRRPSRWCCRAGRDRWRVPTYELREIVAELTARDVRYGAARAMLAQRLAHALLTKMEAAGESPDDRVQDAVARSAPVRKAVDRLWPAVDPVRVVMRAAVRPGGAGPRRRRGPRPGRAGAAAVGRSRPAARSPRRWTLADAVLVDEAADLVEREPSLGHVVLDEAQDLSPMQLRAVGRRCSTGSATVLGDIAQGTTPWATDDWAESLRHLGKPDAHVEVLDRGYRVPARRHRLRRPAAAVIAPGLERAGVGAREPRPPRPGADRLTWSRRCPQRYAGCSPSRARSGVIVADADVAGVSAGRSASGTPCSAATTWPDIGTSPTTG